MCVVGYCFTHAGSTAVLCGVGPFSSLNNLK